MAAKQKKKKPSSQGTSQRGNYDRSVRIQREQKNQTKQNPHQLKSAFSPACIMLTYFGVVNYFSQWMPATTDGFFASSLISLVVSGISYCVYRFIMCREGEDIKKMWAVMIAGNVAASYDQLAILMGKLGELF